MRSAFNNTKGRGLHIGAAVGPPPRSIHAAGRPRHLHAAAERWSLTTKLIDAVYLEADRFIPRAEDRKHVLTVPAKVLADAAKRIKTAAEYGPTAILRLVLSTDGCSVESSSAPASLALPLPGATYTGPDLTIRFKCRYVAEVMAAAGNTATLRFGDPTESAHITGTDPAALFVLMPCRV